MERVRLSSVAKQIRGVSYNGDVSTDVYTNGYLPILRSNNIEEGSLNFEDLVFVPEEFVKEYQILQNGDILITASTGSIKVLGKNGSFESDLKCSFGAFCKVVRATEKVENNYLKHFFQTNYYRRTIQNITNGANINNIKNEHIDDLVIPLPSLAEQKAIAAKLDKAQEIIRYNEEIIAKYDALTQSLFIDMFGDPVRNEKGWEKKTLKEVCSKITDGTHDTPERLKVGVKFITGKHIKPFFIDYENSDYVTEEVHNEIYRRCNPEINDILYTNIGVNFGTAAMNIVKYEFSMKNVALLKFNRKVLTGRYLEYLLNNFQFKEKLKIQFGIGGAQQFLSLANIGKIIVSLPPISLQNQFAERVAVIEAQKQLAQESLVKSQELFSSLLQQSFED